ncbi:hypothetical protein B0H19DRAFT_1061127 [Mycena capillaripes]|nr:hypothetical protein B0H19DRAFT_1061127 [Mycena capillaripes]
MSHRKPPGQPPDDVALRNRGGATRHRMPWEPPGGNRWLTANSLLMGSWASQFDGLAGDGSSGQKIGDLPVNIVPLPRTATHLTVLLEDDSWLSILREQVSNVEFCGSYELSGPSVVLRRVIEGQTAEGTIILQRFDREKFTSGIYRRRLLRLFYVWRIDHRDPPHFHPLMRWNKDMGPRIPENVTYDSWRASGARGQKRKNAVVNTTQHKKKKTLHPPIIDSGLTGSRMAIPTVRRPIGMIWDAEDPSCGYDSTFTILFNIWADNAEKWQELFSTISSLLRVLNNQFVHCCDVVTTKGMGLGPNFAVVAATLMERGTGFWKRILFDPVIQFDQAGVMVRLRMRGIIYSGGDVWYHDGISTGRTCRPQGNLSTFANLLDLHKCWGRKAVAIVYAVE